MRVLILGSGGREHAIGWKISSSSLLEDLQFAPGNAGTAALGVNVDLDPLDFDAVEAHVREQGIHMVIVGPEAPLAADPSPRSRLKFSCDLVAMSPRSRRDLEM